MKIALGAGIITRLIDGDPPHLRDRMDDALSQGDILVMSSLVLHDLAYAAMVSEQAARGLAQLDAFISQVEVVPWTSEDALTAARIRADHQKEHGHAPPFADTELLCAAQALNNDWAIAEGRPTPVALRALAFSFASPLLRLRTIDWSTPSGD